MEPQPHPLFLYPVTCLIFEKADFQTVLSMRLVCKLWKDESFKHIHQNARVVVNRLKKLEDLVKVISTSDEFPPTTFCFKNFDLNSIYNGTKLFSSFGYKIKTLELKGCKWTSSVLRELIFKYLPQLQIMKLEIGFEENENSALPILPMSFGIGGNQPIKLKSIKFVGDFSRQSDVIYDILKHAKDLMIIQLNKITEMQDDLFGTWLFEVIVACNFCKLISLEIDCSLIPVQVDSLLCMNSAHSMKRLCLNLTQVDYSSVFEIIRKFKILECVEFQLNNPPSDLTKTIYKAFPKSKIWVAIHSNPLSKCSFPLHYPVLGIE